MQAQKQKQQQQQEAELKRRKEQQLEMQRQASKAAQNTAEIEQMSQRLKELLRSNNEAQFENLRKENEDELMEVDQEQDGQGSFTLVTHKKSPKRAKSTSQQQQQQNQPEQHTYEQFQETVKNYFDPPPTAMLRPTVLQSGFRGPATTPAVHPLRIIFHSLCPRRGCTHTAEADCASTI